MIHNSYPGNTSITQEAETNPTSLPRIISQNQGQTQGRNKAQAEGSLQGHAMSNVINNNNGHGASHGSPSQNTLNTSSQDTPPSQRESKRKRGENSSSQPASRPINPTVQTSNLIKEKDRIVNVGQCRRCNAHGPFRMEIRNCCRLIAVPIADLTSISITIPGPVCTVARRSKRTRGRQAPRCKTTRTQKAKTHW